MPDPLILLAFTFLEGVITTAVDGFIGNRADAMAVNVVQQITQRLRGPSWTQLPQADLLQCAARRAVLEATGRVCASCLADYPPNRWRLRSASPEVQWLERTRKRIQAELRALATNPSLPAGPMVELRSADLLMADGAPTQVDMAAVLRQQVLAEFPGADRPPAFAMKIRRGWRETSAAGSQDMDWFTLLKHSFLQALQHDTHLYAAFQAQILVDVQQQGHALAAQVDQATADIRSAIAEVQTRVEQRASVKDTVTQAPTTASLHQLRAPVGDFVGRKRHIKRIAEALRRAGGGTTVISGVRGLGGVGKTELAIVLGNHVRDVFPDAQIMLDLRGSRPAEALTPVQALQTIVQVFLPHEKLPDEQDTLVALYRHVLTGKHVLIVADDAADDTQIEPLLPPGGSILLVTSRVRVLLPGMVVVDLDTLSEHEAVTLLRSICQRITKPEATQIVHLCGRLPFAIRISGRLLALDDLRPVAAYISQLEQVHTRLSQLRDPKLSDLRQRSLLEYNPKQDRFSLHELVRVFALARLVEADTERAVRLRHAQHYSQVAASAEHLFLVGGDQTHVGLERFDRAAGLSGLGLDMTRIIEQFAPLLHAVVAIACGERLDERPAVEQALAQAEQVGWRLRGATERIWQGERDAAALTAEIDEHSAQLVHHLLALLALPAPEPPTLPEAVQTALERQDGPALQAALNALPPAEAAAIVAQLERTGRIGVRQEGPDMAQVMQHFTPVLGDIALAAHGDDTARQLAEAALPQLAAQGWRLTDAAQRIWAGERDATALVADLDPNSAQLVRRILGLVADDPTLIVAAGSRQIAELRRQVDAAVAQALARNDTAARVALVEQLTTVAAQVAGKLGAPWQDLATYMRTQAECLREEHGG